jgi:NOL1/NOP2/fmu family ribosome biogenesis protein/precorrin-6B methylase 2
VQIAAAMKGKGLLVANDINYDRVKALVKNIELCGVRNAIVTNESPEKLSKAFGAYFDRIIIDAPCSGEGMFRKDPDAARSWENYKCEKCAGMQWDILQHAHNMLKPGGHLVYSTCTFSPEEDEKMIARFVNTFGCYEILKIPVIAGIDKGKPQWADGNECLSGTARLWPHKLKGEGHFVALLQKKKTGTDGTELIEENVQKYAMPQTVNCADSIDALQLYRNFENQNLNIQIDGYFLVKGNNLYCLPEPAPCLDTLKVAKFGWYLGEMQKGRFEPSHSFVVSLKKDDIRRVTSFGSSSAEVLRYLKGETLILEGEKGFTGICVDGFTLGWAKQTGDMLKNLYPKGWRKTT